MAEGFVKLRGQDTKEQAAYRRGTGKDRCRNCMNMRKDGGCTMVMGKVKPNDVCDYHETQEEYTNND